MSLDNRYEFLKKLGVGFESLFETVDKLGPAYFTEDYPPFNLVKTDKETYVVQVSMVGYDKDSISASHASNVLTIKAAGSAKPAEAADDVYLHHGIKDGDNFIKFPISPGLKFEGATFDDGILYVTYKTRKENDAPLADGAIEIVDALEAEERQVLPHTGKVAFDKTGKPKLRKQRMGFRKYAYDSAGRPVAIMDLENEDEIDEEETEKLLKAHHKDKAAEVLEEVKEKVAEKKAEVEAKKEEKKAEIVEKAKAIEEKVLEKKAEVEEKKEEKKAEKKDVTVEVSAPDNKPQVLEAVVKKESDDKVSVELKDATVEVSDDVKLEVVKTKEGKADIVVAVKDEDKKVLDEAEVDLKETVKEVVETLEAEPVLPEKTEKAEDKKTVLVDKEVKDKPTVEVTVPKEIPSVVAVKKDEKPTDPEVPALVVEDSSENISETAELIPVVTPEGKPDVVLAVEPEVKKEIEDKGGDVKDVVEKAIAKAVEDVKTSEPVDEKVVEEASKAPVVEEVKAKAAEEKTELVNKEATDKGTVEVKTEITEPVKVVEVKLDEENIDPIAKEVKPVKVEDATVEVSDGAELSVVKTEEGKTDIVVAATPEVKEELAKANTTVEEVVAAVVKAPESVAKEEKGEEVTVIVDKAVEDKPTVEVKVEKEVPQVVVAEVIEPEVAKDAVAVELKDTAEDIPADAELVAVVTPKEQPDIVVAIPKEAAEKATVDEIKDAVEKAVNQADVVVATPVANTLAVEEASEVPEVVEKLDEIAKEPATLVVDKEETEKPTVEVTLAAEESPQVVAVKLDEKPSNPEVPAIVVEDATIEVSDTAELVVAKTEEGKADVVVAIEPEVKKELEDKGVVVEEVVVKALETNDAVPEVPVVEEELVEKTTVMVDKTVEDKPTVEVTTGDVLPQVVEAKVVEAVNPENVAIELVDVKDEIPADTELVAVVTPKNQPDLVVAVDAEAKVKLDEAGANTVEVIEKAVNIADVEVIETESTTLDAEKVEEASVVPEVAEKLDVIAKEPATLILHKEDEAPTVEVTLAAEDAPQIVEVKLDEKPSNPEVPAIVVEDATVEVKSETAELIPVTTEEGKSDVIVAIEPEVKKELEDKGVTVEEVVGEALETNDAVPVLPTETAVAPVKEVEVKAENSDTAVKVEIPEVVSQVVEVTKVDDKVVIEDTSADIASTAELAVVETPEGLPNIVVATTPEVKEELAKVDLEPVEVVEKAIEETKPIIETVVEANVTVDVSEIEVKTVTSNVTSKPVVVVKKPTSN